MKHYVYRFMNEGEVLYTGETKSMKNRMPQHFLENRGTCKECIEQISRIEYLIFDNSVVAKMFELYYMNRIKPKYNIRDKTEESIPPIKEYEDMLTLWDLYAENIPVSVVISQMVQTAKEEKQRLIQEFDKCNLRLTELTKELDLTHRRMKRIVENLAQDTWVCEEDIGTDDFIYGCPYNQAKYITEKAADTIRRMVELDIVHYYS